MSKNQQHKIEKLIDFIIDFAEKNNITAYQLGKKSTISASSVNKIFSKENKSPKITTLLKLQNDLENMVVASQSKYDVNEKFATKVSESPEDYKIPFADLKIDDKLNIINQKLDILLETH
jgi:transcriptional regulator with XRE-family HTH domain